MSQAWVDEMAALWFVKAQDGMSASEKNTFEKWLHVNPAHQKAYTQFEALWHELDGLAPSQNRACPQKRVKPWWGYAGVAAIAFFAIGILQWNAFSTRLELAQNLVTPVGAMREYTLSDGTKLFLDTDSNVSVEYYAHKRLVKLHQGQIALHVSKDTTRPLFVDAYNVQVRVTGTIFEVRHVEDEVRVSVEEGSVDVSSKRSHDGEFIKRASLYAKDQIILDERGFVLSTLKLQNDAIAPWRNGRLVFDKTPLEDVLFEFERYGAKPAFIASSQLALMPLSGSFEIERFGSFLELLPKVLPVKVTQDLHSIAIEKL
ncbi:FecR family protein [Sulfurospirillum arsenophilum]|uniref:FecR family protein n=1 Tax=Sulfurospirillum arsenophilum TaxID=56698 RepID=UPI0005A997A5|nr:FecR domain-containing protein [Sulfurospirillum arsenophilum]